MILIAILHIYVRYRYWVSKQFEIKKQRGRVQAFLILAKYSFTSKYTMYKICLLQGPQRLTVHAHGMPTHKTLNMKCPLVIGAQAPTWQQLRLTVLVDVAMNVVTWPAVALVGGRKNWCSKGLFHGLSSEALSYFSWVCLLCYLVK